MRFWRIINTRKDCAGHRLEHMGENHGGAGIRVAQQLLHYANIRARLQQMNGPDVIRSTMFSTHGRVSVYLVR